MCTDGVRNGVWPPPTVHDNIRGYTEREDLPVLIWASGDAPSLHKISHRQGKLRRTEQVTTTGTWRADLGGTRRTLDRMEYQVVERNQTRMSTIGGYGKQDATYIV